METESKTLVELVDRTLKLRDDLEAKRLELYQAQQENQEPVVVRLTRAKVVEGLGKFVTVLLAKHQESVQAWKEATAAYAKVAQNSPTLLRNVSAPGPKPGEPVEVEQVRGHIRAFEALQDDMVTVTPDRWRGIFQTGVEGVARMDAMTVGYRNTASSLGASAGTGAGVVGADTSWTG